MEHKHRIVYDILPCEQKVRNCWDVKKEGDHSVIRHFGTKEEAVQYGRELAKNHHERGGLGQLRIHDHLGRIEKESTYGENPETSKDEVDVVVKCEQDCVTLIDECLKGMVYNLDACRTKFKGCVQSCKSLGS